MEQEQVNQQTQTEETEDNLVLELEGLQEESSPPSPPSTLTFDQVMQLVQLATQQREASTGSQQQQQVDILEQKQAEFNELYRRVQQGENDAFMPFLKLQGELAALQAERAAIRSSREQTAAIQASMNLNTVLAEMREKEAKSPRGFSKLENNWYQRMKAEVQANPSLYASLDAVRKAGKLLMGEMYIDALERMPARAPNAVARDAGGRFSARDGTPPPSPGNLPREAVAAGFTSEEEFKKYAKIAEGWIDL